MPQGSHTITHFTNVVGLVTINNDTAYRVKVQDLAAELLQRQTTLLYSKDRSIQGEDAERVEWSTNISHQENNAKKRLYFFWNLKQTHLTQKLLLNFYSVTIGSLLTCCCTVWHGSCTAEGWEDLQQTKELSRLKPAFFPEL